MRKTLISLVGLAFLAGCGVTTETRVEETGSQGDICVAKIYGQADTGDELYTNIIWHSGTGFGRIDYFGKTKETIAFGEEIDFPESEKRARISGCAEALGVEDPYKGEQE